MRCGRKWYCLAIVSVILATAVAWLVHVRNASAGESLPAPFAQRLAARPFPVGLHWFNTARPIELSQLRGKFVLLDFWTLGCINCMHIIPELHKLEKAWPNQLVVIGVHSAKFAAKSRTRASKRRCSGTASSTRW